MRAALIGLALCGQACAGQSGTLVGSDNVLTFEGSFISFETQFVPPKKVSKGECTPGSIAFEDGRYWGCKLVPQYFEIPMVEKRSK